MTAHTDLDDCGVDCGVVICDDNYTVDRNGGDGTVSLEVFSPPCTLAMSNCPASLVSAPLGSGAMIDFDLDYTATGICSALELQHLLTCNGGIDCDFDNDSTADIELDPAGDLVIHPVFDSVDVCISVADTANPDACSQTGSDCECCFGVVSACAADFSHDGSVNTTDLGIMKTEFFRTNCATVPCQADINGDNKVNTSDLGIMKVQFFRTGCPVP